MYLLTSHIPIYLDGQRTLLSTDWKRSAHRFSTPSAIAKGK